MDFFPAFKEWALVCEALGEGKQTILVRKGGIAEGKAGFRFQHEKFFLFPTWFHEQLKKTKLSAETPLSSCESDVIEIRYLASVEWTELVEASSQLQQLSEFHILHDSIVQERFYYNEKPGIHIALVRIFRLATPHRIPFEKKYGGCRSWVTIPSQKNLVLVPVLTEEAHLHQKNRLKKLIGKREPIH